MTSINQEPARRPDSGLSYVPVAWLCITMALSAYGLVSSWRVIGGHDLPDSVAYFVYSGLAGGIVTILWGLYLLGLAFNRSARFPRHFIIWQVATIVWLAARLAYVLLAPDFGFSARSMPSRKPKARRFWFRSLPLCSASSSALCSAPASDLPPAR
ncbi:hypothetical protein ACFX5Q_06995 [Mesorhizobium sp. IMUNJ 23033]|uniref:hypothetical protein n=1 Tax=Mesorhizobium sp. IMUNJ 23033 TaxID=3378039 RepID=UPI00384BE390